MGHEDWLPTLAAAAGNPDIKDQLKAGTELIGRTYRNYVDGQNMLDYFSGTAEASPRETMIYVNDDAEIVAVRFRDWKAVYKENRAEAFEVWREPFVDLRVPLLFNLRRDPFEKAQHNSNTYNDWFLDHVYLINAGVKVAQDFLMTLVDYPPSHSPGSFNLDNMMKSIEAMANNP